LLFVFKDVVIPNMNVLDFLLDASKPIGTKYNFIIKEHSYQDRVILIYEFFPLVSSILCCNIITTECSVADEDIK
jgi:hypothetical protein